MRPYILLCIAFLSFQTLIAQYGNGYPRQRRNMGYTQPRMQPTAPKQIERKDAATVVTEQMPMYIEALQLDDFEKEIFKQMLIDHYNNREALLTNPDIALTDKQDILIQQDDNFTQELSSILSEEEIEKFKTLNLKKPDKKDKKKKKKRARKKKEDDIKEAP